MSCFLQQPRRTYTLKNQGDKRSERGRHLSLRALPSAGRENTQRSPGKFWPRHSEAQTWIRSALGARVLLRGGVWADFLEEMVKTAFHWNSLKLEYVRSSPGALLKLHRAPDSSWINIPGASDSAGGSHRVSAQLVSCGGLRPTVAFHTAGRTTWGGRAACRVQWRVGEARARTGCLAGVTHHTVIRYKRNTGDK